MFRTRDGEYIQPCECASRVRLARVRAGHLRDQATSARKDAELADLEANVGDATDFRAFAAECEAQARQILCDARRAHPPCLVCGNTGEVVGNGTYGGPAHRVRVVVGVI